MITMDVYSLTLLHVWGLLLFLGMGEGLNCWHCIADNCDLNPEDNYKAYKTECQPGQQCQKVFFEMHSDVKATVYRSTVRSCAEQCQDQDEFLNCSDWKRTTRGCVKRSCCSDEDLCNAAVPIHLISVSGLPRLGLVLAAMICWGVVLMLVS